MYKIKEILNQMSRRKVILEERIEPLKRVLKIQDLVLIGISGTIGSGIYVITGSVVEKAGPACLLSYIISGFAAFLSALCYCEFSELYPTSGSAYSYTYFSLGELAAFIIGWNLILEYMVGAASVVRAFSIYVSSYLNYNFVIYRTVPFIGATLQLDLFSFIVSIMFTITTLYEIKKAKIINSISTVACVISIILMCIIGIAYVDLKNWTNFAPHGLNGVLSAASTCFYAYIGFDVVASTAEEAIQPEYSIPVSIMMTIAICTFLYVSSTLVITLMAPFNLFTYETTFASIFEYRRIPYVVHIITIGAIFGFVGCIYSSFLPTTRIFYAMANDGLLYRFLGVVSPTTSSPINAAIVSGMLISILSFVISMEDLIQMMSIGTLMAYTMVSFCVLLLRYNVQVVDYDNVEIKFMEKNSSMDIIRRRIMTISKMTPLKSLISLLILIILLCLLLVNRSTYPSLEYTKLLVIVLIFLIVSCLSNLKRYTSPNSKGKGFKVPFLPWLPGFAIFLNVLLLCTLKLRTWVSFTVWLSIGIFIYISYGYKNSLVSKK